MRKKISLKETIFGHMHLGTPDGFAIAANVMTDANYEFPLLGILQRMKERRVDANLLNRLQREAEVYIETLQERLANRELVSPEDGLVMSVKILGELESFPAIQLYREGEALCEQALARFQTMEAYPFFAQLRDAYAAKMLSEVKAVMAAHPRGFDAPFS
jgi:hypothetical protein